MINVKVLGKERKLLKDLVVAKFILCNHLGLSDGILGILSDVHTEFREEGINFVYKDEDDLEYMSKEIWEEVEPEDWDK